MKVISVDGETVTVLCEMLDTETVAGVYQFHPPARRVRDGYSVDTNYSGLWYCGGVGVMCGLIYE